MSKQGYVNKVEKQYANIVIINITFNLYFSLFVIKFVFEIRMKPNVQIYE